MWWLKWLHTGLLKGLGLRYGSSMGLFWPKILNKDRLKPCLFTFFYRLAQVENNCKQMDFERSLLSIFGLRHLRHFGLDSIELQDFCL